MATTLRPYYERALVSLKADLEVLWGNPDRTPKMLMDLLKAAEQCEQLLAGADDGSAQWRKLRPETQAKIEQLIKQDLGEIP